MGVESQEDERQWENGSSCGSSGGGLTEGGLGEAQGENRWDPHSPSLAQSSPAPSGCSTGRVDLGEEVREEVLDG